MFLFLFSTDPLTTYAMIYIVYEMLTGLLTDQLILDKWLIQQIIILKLARPTSAIFQES